jgi:ergothioneine biosynthesis protein EgtB
MNDADDGPDQVQKLIERFSKTRRMTENLCSSLEIEDFVVQSSPEVSPPKWHLGHTSWFFDRFILQEHLPAYRPLGRGYDLFFNSYYESVGRPLEKPRRGTLSRPTVREIRQYRSLVDEAIEGMLRSENAQRISGLVELGIHHEEQHQELLLMDIQHNFWVDPLRPAPLLSGLDQRTHARVSTANRVVPFGWIPFEGGRSEMGHAGSGFCFDNERPVHSVLLRPFQLASRLVTQGEFLEFVADLGYSRPEFWLADGWIWVNSLNLKFPLYWQAREEGWQTMTLFGMTDLDPVRPVSHLSYYEADAFARWKGLRLPTEMEWEYAAQAQPIRGNLLECGAFRPEPASGSGLLQLYGDLWEWTSSSYSPYPGYRPWEGGLGEYNGKFMCNQFVLRGGSFATPRGHIRRTYRNFYSPASRWQFSGLRLACD